MDKNIKKYERVPNVRALTQKGSIVEEERCHAAKGSTPKKIATN